MLQLIQLFDNKRKSHHFWWLVQCGSPYKRKMQL